MARDGRGGPAGESRGKRPDYLRPCNLWQELCFLESLVGTLKVLNRAVTRSNLGFKRISPAFV